MSLACLFGKHTPSVSSIARRPNGFVGICEGCARPLERSLTGSWTASAPLDAEKQRAA